MTARERIRAYGGAAGLAVVGGICGFLVPGLVGQIIRLTLITLAMGAVVILVFYEIGLSEDKEREREEEERRRHQPEHEEPSRHLWSPRPRRPN
ncbi:MAG TPA: hypothetical protein VJU60_07420 [Thermoleophilaceae bacterium]|nr:hypothetical protein [Thermoleophilaceae bacterium]